jgi:hypothetical protein
VRGGVEDDIPLSAAQIDDLLSLDLACPVMVFGGQIFSSVHFGSYAGLATVTGMSRSVPPQMSRAVDLIGDPRRQSRHPERVVATDAQQAERRPGRDDIDPGDLGDLRQGGA